MMWRVWNAYKVELRKAVARRFTWLLPLLLVACVWLTALVQPISSDGTGDYRFIAYVTPLALNILGLIMLLMYSAGLISSEVGSGTICTVLIRPLYRHEFVCAKLMLAFTYAMVLEISVAVASWSAAIVLGDLTGVIYGGEAIYSNLDMFLTYLLGMVVALFPLGAAAAFGVMLSSLTRSTSAAIGSAVGIWLAVDFVKHPLRLGRFFFSSYVETPWNVFLGRCDGLDPAWMPEVLWTLAVSCCWLGAFCFFAMVAMSRRNLQA